MMPKTGTPRLNANSVTPSPEREFSVFREFRVLGVTVHAVQIPGVIAQMEEWISLSAKGQYIAVTGMHGVMEAQHDPQFRKILDAAGLVVPDGMPLVWLGRWHGFEMRRRVYGPELMVSFCEQTAAKGYRHFFYGGAPGVAENLACRFTSRFPGMVMAGTYSPPFRTLTAEEDSEVVQAIEAARTDILWIGLSTPKQERWMFEHRDQLKVPVLVGVGAAFDFHAGRTAQAPAWMGDHGLEWLFRVSHEPRRLWRRYLIYGAEFAALVLLELLGLRKAG
jgi:N-acetylglucosaminyldiphosphoundecaprenol N-acetyl-beta-D-mannosaminyltransferase